MERLYRSRHDRKFTGLCGGLAQNLGIDSTLIRVLVVITTFITAGTVFWIYLIASFVVPKEPYHAYDEFDHRFSQKEYRQHRHHNWESSRTSRSTMQAEPVDASPLDAMMDNLEKKAMQKELEELRERIAKYEKGEISNGRI